jgi:NADH-quinone oxidoreductase subunit D
MQTIEIKELKTEEMTINMWPQHPSTHGVMKVMIKTDGELIVDAQPEIGYLHRCAEKIGENLDYLQFIPYTDRMDYLAAMNNNWAYCAAVERLLGDKGKVPERGEYIRVIIGELNRIASHLVAVGTYGLDTGAITPFLYAFREREKICTLFEKVCGARLTYNYYRIGGVSRDLSDEILKEIRVFIKTFKKTIAEYNNLLSFNKIFLDRTVGIGVISPEIAIAYGVTGPSLRGSGVKRDVRRDRPYSLYPKFKFDIPVGNNKVGVTGDCWNRYYVRVCEMAESVKIIEQALDGIPAGDFKNPEVRTVIKPPKGDAYVALENPKGELGFYIVSDATGQPYRLKARGPSFSNISVLQAISKGCFLADLVAIIGSLDIVLGEIDR